MSHKGSFSTSMLIRRSAAYSCTAPLPSRKTCLQNSFHDGFQVSFIVCPFFRCPHVESPTSLVYLLWAADFCCKLPNDNQDRRYALCKFDRPGPWKCSGLRPSHNDSGLPKTISSGIVLNSHWGSAYDFRHIP